MVPPCYVGGGGVMMMILLQGAAGQCWCAAEAAGHRQGPCSGLGPGFSGGSVAVWEWQMLGRADLGQPGIPKVPLRHAVHLSWGCSSQHSWRCNKSIIIIIIDRPLATNSSYHHFTLCSEAVGPAAWQCKTREIHHRLGTGGSPLVCVAGSVGLEYLPVVPSFQTIPSADSWRVGLSPFCAACSRRFRP
jgi:hypothetical protein